MLPAEIARRPPGHRREDYLGEEQHMSWTSPKMVLRGLFISSKQYLQYRLGHLILLLIKLTPPD
jgi:hypothetical protein